MLSDGGEGLDGSVDLIGSVGGGELDTDAGESFGNDGVAEANDVDVVFHHLVGKVSTP